MTWDENNDDLVVANRDYAFPPLHAEDDDGTRATEFQIVVPYHVNPQRWGQLIDSLHAWADRQGLTDYIDPNQIEVSTLLVDKEESHGEEE